MDNPELHRLAELLAPRCHAFWRDTRAEQDIHWGPVPSATEHPCMKQWDDLTDDQQAEDVRFVEHTLQVLQEMGFQLVATPRKVFITDLLWRAGGSVSTSQSRQVVAMGSVKLNGEPIAEIGKKVLVRPGDLIEVGSRRKITVTPEMLESV